MVTGSVDLGLAELRALMRLPGELRELGGDPEAWRGHLVDELGRLCGATVGVAFEQWTPRGVTLERARREWDSFSYADEPAPTEQAFSSAHVVDRGFDGPRARAQYFDHVYGGGRPDDPAWPPVLARLRAAPAAFEGSTHSSFELVDRRTWGRSPFVQERMRACGIGEYILSLQYSHELGCSLGLVLARPWGERPFSPRDVACVELVHAELGRAVRRDPFSAVEALPPRQRQTLALLLEGKREKEVADALGLSTATVHGYVKALYRRFGVSSRAELLASLLGAERRAGPRLRGLPHARRPGQAAMR